MGVRDLTNGFDVTPGGGCWGTLTSKHLNHNNATPGNLKCGYKGLINTILDVLHEKDKVSLVCVDDVLNI